MKICPVCETEFIPKSPRHQKQKHCSVKCCRKFYARNNPEKIKQSREKYRQNNPEASFIANLKHKYGLTVEEHQALFKKAEYSCMICKQPRNKLCVDHNHETGKVRGILCHNCNAALGLLDENIEVIKTMIKYLEEE